MDAYNWGMLAGAVVGGLIGVALVVVILKLTKTNKNWKCEFDERQQITRGIGYKYAFVTLLVCELLFFVIDLAKVPIPMEYFVMQYFFICLSIVVMAVYCIWHEAYFAMNESKKRVMIVFFVLGCVCAAVGYFMLQSISGRSFGMVNLGAAFMLLSISAVVFIKRMVSNKVEEDVEE